MEIQWGVDTTLCAITIIYKKNRWPYLLQVIIISAS